MQLEEKIYQYFVTEGLNCAQTSLRILAEEYPLSLPPEVEQSALGLNGGGKYRGQCGLVEGPLLFLGILGSRKQKSRDEINAVCHEYAQQFETKYGSLSCRDLRPEGFREGLPPNLCLPLALKTIPFALKFMEESGW